MSKPTYCQVQLSKPLPWGPSRKGHGSPRGTGNPLGLRAQGQRRAVVAAPDIGAGIQPGKGREVNIREWGSQL